MEQRYQGRSDVAMTANYYWMLKRECEYSGITGKSNSLRQSLEEQRAHY